MFCVGRCNVFCFGIFNPSLLMFWEDLGGSEKNLQFSSCPEKDILQQWS